MMRTLVPILVRLPMTMPPTDSVLCPFVFRTTTRPEGVRLVTVPVGIRVLQVSWLLPKHLVITRLMDLVAGPSLLLMVTTELNTLGRCGFNRAVYALFRENLLTV